LSQCPLLSSHRLRLPYLGQRGQYPFSLLFATSSHHSSSPYQKRKFLIPEKPCVAQTRASKTSRVGDSFQNCVYSRSRWPCRSRALPRMWCSKARASFMSTLLLQHQSCVEVKVEKQWLGFCERGTLVTDWLPWEQTNCYALRLGQLPHFALGACYQATPWHCRLIQGIHVTSTKKWL
jgi:hypothetical protein